MAEFGKVFLHGYPCFGSSKKDGETQETENNHHYFWKNPDCRVWLWNFKFVGMLRLHITDVALFNESSHKQMECGKETEYEKCAL